MCRLYFIIRMEVLAKKIASLTAKVLVIKHTKQGLCSAIMRAGHCLWMGKFILVISGLANIKSPV